ncbi:hypothetical protein RhiirB3_379835 [Rhizophagus irregularis]|nr:hypothetical protein RhiirB3_379835 [Rhizophagus irregularis]
MFQNRYTLLTIVKIMVTKINETHEDSIIIDKELDNERNKYTENEEIINENPSDSDEDSDENSDKVLSGESDDEYFSEESNEEPDEEPDISEKIIDESLKNEHMPY